MGKIFGISDLPVSTIHSAIKGTRFEPIQRTVTSLPKEQMADKFVAKTKTPVSNAFVKMRNGIGRLMNHFSKSKA